MKKFGGPALLLDRSDINTDEIIPAKYLTEITKKALKPHLLEDLLLEGRRLTPTPALQQARVVVTRANFGCGSSREHAVWAFEVNDINVVIAESFARIFRQNMFNCGILAVDPGTCGHRPPFRPAGGVRNQREPRQGTVDRNGDRRRGPHPHLRLQPQPF